MELNTKTRTEKILLIMKVLAWITFIGLLIETGAILISFSITLFNAEGASNLYKGLDLFELRQYSTWYYIQYVSIILSISAMKAYMLSLIIKTLSNVKLKRPFSPEMSKVIERISYVLFGIWCMGVVSDGHTKWLMRVVTEVHAAQVAEEFLFAAGLVFIISQIFKRGVEIQSENELTV